MLYACRCIFALKYFNTFITVALADSTPSTPPVQQTNKDVASIKVEKTDMPKPAIVSPTQNLPAVTSTSKTTHIIPQSTIPPSSKTKKRQADTTTPGNPSEQPAPKAAKIPARRGSTRPIKKPTRDLPELPNQVIMVVWSNFVHLSLIRTLC